MSQKPWYCEGCGHYVPIVLDAESRDFGECVNRFIRCSKCDRVLGDQSISKTHLRKKAEKVEGGNGESTDKTD